MKKIALSVIILMTGLPAFAQTQWATVGSNIYNTNTGNVGIGTTLPGQKLVVNGNILTIGRTFIGNSYSTISQINDAASAVFGCNAIADTATNVRMIIKNTNATVGAQAIRMDYLQGISFHTLSGGVTGGNVFSSERMRITTDGNVAIGTTNPFGYKLAVNGNMIAQSITVKLYAKWPDYVFKKDYRLPSLLTVKAYIDQNKRLPEMPAEKEVAKDGINLGEMNKLLTKKVEELTLYLIEKDQQLQDQHKAIQSLQQQINRLAKKVNH